jgi:translation initiation factor 2 subunit 1
MIKEFPEESELILCAVSKIMGTTVFVNIENYKKEGVISTSEVAPGRIRNIRDYVTVNKKIVCKVLRVNKEKGTIDLSLRRVSQKETREVLEEFKKEKDALLVLKLALKDKAVQVAERIKEKYDSLDAFLSETQKNPSILKEYAEKDDAEKILELTKERKKEKKFQYRAIISISSNAANGVTAIKNALLAAKDVEIIYIGAPNYSMTAESSDPKDAEKKFKEAVSIITEKIKASGGKLECKEIK